MWWEVGMENGKRYCVMCLADGDKTLAVCLITVGGTNGDPECDAGYCGPCSETMQRNGWTIKPLPEAKKEKKMRGRQGLPQETIEVIRLNPDESAKSLAGRLNIAEHQVYSARAKFRTEASLKPVVVDPHRKGSASALLGALEKQDNAGGTFVVPIHLTDAEIARIINGMSAEKKRQFFAGGLRAALLGE